MFEITKKDARKFRELPLMIEKGITYYYDFTIMDRYVVFHSKNDIFVQYEMYDKVSHIQHKILKGKAMFCDKNYSLLVPFVIYSVRNELGHPWGVQLRGKINGGNLVEILFRSVMPQLGFTIREEQIQMAQTMLEGLGKKKITLYEAGVGTGKTMSYLIAAFLISKMDVTYQHCNLQY